MSELIRIVDIETTGEAPPEHAIVEIATLDIVDGILGFGRSFLVCPGREIPPEASAVHHLVDADVADAQVAADVIPAALMDTRPTVLVAHNAKFESQWLDAYADGVPWICSMKSAMRVWPESPSFSVQFLRYWLHLGDLGAEAMPPHRALPDCVVTAHIFARLRQEASLEQMIEWTKEPPLWPKIPFGKHKGQPWSAVPQDYFDWILKQSDFDADTKWNVRHEMQRRAAERREAYTSAACRTVALCVSLDDLQDWFMDEVGHRVEYGIQPGTPEYDHIVKACSLRKAAILESIPPVDGTYIKETSECPEP